MKSHRNADCRNKRPHQDTESSDDFRYNRYPGKHVRQGQSHRMQYPREWGPRNNFAKPCSANPYPTMRRKGSGAQRPTEKDSNSSNTAKLRPIRLLVHFVLS